MKFHGKKILYGIWGAGGILWLVFIFQLLGAQDQTIIENSGSEDSSTEISKISPDSLKSTPARTSKFPHQDGSTKSPNNSPTNTSILACINVNTAGPDELMSLKGIGQVIAGRIIEYRQKNGKFKHKNDLIKIKGIGKIKLQNIENYICF